jgi:hypothetical protein
MGRPINKRHLGQVESGTTDGNFTAIVYVPGASVSENGIIISQRSETLFVVNDTADGTGNQGSCRLVDKATPAEGEMVIQGFVAGSGTPVNIRKLHNRTVIDFDNNRYDWEIQDDSTANILVLTQM